MLRGPSRSVRMKNGSLIAFGVVAMRLTQRGPVQLMVMAFLFANTRSCPLLAIISIARIMTRLGTELVQKQNAEDSRAPDDAMILRGMAARTFHPGRST